VRRDARNDASVGVDGPPYPVDRNWLPCDIGHALGHSVLRDRERPVPPRVSGLPPDDPSVSHPGVDDGRFGGHALDGEATPSRRVVASRPRAHRVIHHAQRWTPAEWARVTERAWACGMTPSRFVREVAVGAQPKGYHHARQSRAIYELGRIGTDLRARLRRTDGGSDGLSDDALRAFHRAVLDAIARLAPVRARRPAGP